MRPSERIRTPGGYAELRDYAVIGDGRTVAAIAPDGRIDWLPLPALDTPPVIAALIDSRHGGHFALRPVGEFESRREYVPGTNVLRTTFRTLDGAEAVVTDALVTGVAGRLPWAELARRIDGVAGSIEFTWSVEPGSAFTGDPVQRIDTVHGPLLRAGTVDLVLVGFEHGRTDPHDPASASAASRGLPGASGAPARFEGAFRTSPGSRHLIALCGTDDEPIHLPDPRIVDQGVDRSIENWATWSREFSYDGPWPEAVQRSALALKLLIHSPTGAIAAAATTGLPENERGTKNYDYRYAWVRDLAYTVGALTRFGLREETHAAVSWALKTLKRHDGELGIFYTLDGATPDPVRRTAAEGWNGIGPVDSGNQAAGQLQLGVYADVVGIMRLYVEAGNILDGSTADLLEEFANSACRRWPEKDSGMWELPKKRHYVSSKIGCWRALDDALRLVDLGELRPHPDSLALWKKNRGLLADWIAKHGWSEKRQAYVMSKGSTALDASILLHASAPFGPPERMRGTVERIRSELGTGPHLYRYTGVDREEAAFVACGFWLVQALATLGERDDATARMSALVAEANDVGLFAEMIDPGTHRFFGNLPQGLSHLALINAAVALE
ncbi:glycoside hydrolase family 15 protein [Herbiconiux moechotypicola]|uniref:Glycoside hydrolase family 15 protein n=1 Tax=Herbiconiux moechotypicola TaxID=637393 RepID=A0ABN3DM40_9MICO|nr:glycoside hydrolase family 15 protein [Herbiconiux moechotypicola]MCS5730229.1 glycoside hydrolase family 15 protein [Herbiconiux moechotypicola]